MIKKVPALQNETEQDPHAEKSYFVSWRQTQILVIEQNVKTKHECRLHRLRRPMGQTSLRAQTDRTNRALYVMANSQFRLYAMSEETYGSRLVVCSLLRSLVFLAPLSRDYHAARVRSI